MHVLATAGHVDHGKTTLVRALTGMDPDRLAEEKARGLTIDLGFAWTALPSGREVAFVDVPGHVRFIKNMLAGVGAVHACLFVVDAGEGWKPQSEEHLRILELLGLRDGAVALTKVAALDPSSLSAAQAAIADRLERTFLADAPLVPVDVPAGVGLDDLRDVLDRLLASVPTGVDAGRPRLWIDRSFPATGSGTVVTGTLTGGSVAVGDTVLVVPGRRRVRVRALQTHQQPVDRSGPGRRLAVNLAGIGHGDLGRGDALVAPDQWEPTRTVDCSLRVLEGATRAVARRGAWHAYFGSGDHVVSLRVLGGEEIEPGTAGLVRLHLPVELPLLPGDRFVLRDSGAGTTVAGGAVLDVDPVLPAATARPTRSADRVIAERGWIEADHLERLTGERRDPNVGRWVVDPGEVDRLSKSLRERVTRAGRAGVDLAQLDERERAVLALVEGITVEQGVAAIGAARPDRHAFVEALRAAPFTPPTPADAGVDAREVRSLIQRGDVVERDGVYFAREAVDVAARKVSELLAERPDGFTVAELRDALATTRKYVLPLLAHLDATGVTRRRGDLRIAGPRLADRAAPSP